MAENRIYVVEGGDRTRLVDAANPAQAIRFCAMGQYKARAAKPRDVAELVAKGVQVEVAAEDAQGSLPV